MILFILAPEASAATCENQSRPPVCGSGGCSITSVPGNVFEYHIVEDPTWSVSFTAVQRDEIGFAATAWSGLRGSSWTVSAGIAVSAASVATDMATAVVNGVNEVAPVDDAWWLANNIPITLSAVAPRAYDETSCLADGGDVFVRVEAPFEDALPSVYTNSDPSFPQTMLHEFGHLAGFGHENSDITLMNSDWPHGGDPGDGGSYVVWPDEALLMSALYAGPGASDDDYFLAKWGPAPGAPSGDGREVWTDESAMDPRDWPVPETWEWCPGEYLGDGVGSGGPSPGPYNVPAPVLLGAHTVAANVPVTVEWKLVGSGDSCFSSTYLIASETYTAVAGEMIPIRIHDHPVFPSDEFWCIPSSMPYDTSWQVCAQIITPNDNPSNDTVYSDKLFELASFASCCGLPHGACDGATICQ